MIYWFQLWWNNKGHFNKTKNIWPKTRETFPVQIKIVWWTDVLVKLKNKMCLFPRLCFFTTFTGTNSVQYNYSCSSQHPSALSIICGILFLFSFQKSRVCQSIYGEKTNSNQLPVLYLLRQSLEVRAVDQQQWAKRTLFGVLGFFLASWTSLSLVHPWYRVHPSIFYHLLHFWTLGECGPAWTILQSTLSWPVDLISNLSVSGLWVWRWRIWRKKWKFL